MMTTITRRTFLSALPVGAVAQLPHPPHVPDPVLDEVAHELARIHTAIRLGPNPRSPEHLRALASQLRITAAASARHDALVTTAMRRLLVPAEFDWNAMKAHLAPYADLSDVVLPSFTAEQLARGQAQIRRQGIALGFRATASALDLFAGHLASLDDRNRWPVHGIDGRVLPDVYTVRIGQPTGAPSAWCLSFAQEIQWFGIQVAIVCAAVGYWPVLQDTCFAGTIAYAAMYAYYWYSCP
jgi:hypothetical protein